MNTTQTNENNEKPALFVYNDFLNNIAKCHITTSEQFFTSIVENQSALIYFEVYDSEITTADELNKMFSSLNMVVY